jgi:diguanylate cyclase (GGDEF)-like protein
MDMAEGESDGLVGREISGSTTSVILGYVRLVRGERGVDALLRAAGETRPVAVLQDPSGWSSYDAALRLFDAAAEVTGDPEVGRSIGAHLLNQHSGTEVAALLRSLGSTRELLRNIAATASKYSTIGSMEPVDLGDSEGVVAAITRAPYSRSRHFCLYTEGVLSQASVLFGHDPASVEELECQTRGDPRCLYRVRWVAESAADPHRRVAHLESLLAGLTGRFEALQATATAFVTAANVEEVLETVTRRAGLAVRAPKFLLAVQLPSEDGVRLHHDGFASVGEASAVATRILFGESVDTATHLVVAVESARSHFGVLAAIQPAGSTFFPQERQLLEAYAAHAAAALEVAASLEEARRQNETARALLDFGRSLAEVATTDQIVARLAAALPSIVDCDSGTVVLWDEEAEVGRLAATFGVAEESLAPFAGLEIRFEDTPAVAVLLEQREPLFIDASTDDPFLSGLMAIAGMGSAAVVPIVAHDTALGMVAVGRVATTVRAEPHIVERLSGVADQTATALVNARLLEAVQTEALHDPLTGLANARLLARQADRALADAGRADSHVSLLFLDLDHFKPVNDELGHDAGDDVLRMCARRLKAAVRETDTVARLGGDEFVVLMPDTSREVAEHCAARLRHVLEEPFVIDGRPLRLSGSVGIAVSTAGDDGFRPLLKRADAEMYAAKAGRSSAD